MLVVPRAMRRVRRSHARAMPGAAGGSGQISTRLRSLPEDSLDAIFDPEPHLFRVLTEEELEPAIMAVQETPGQSDARTWGVVVAGVGFEPTTFGL